MIIDLKELRKRDEPLQIRRDFSAEELQFDSSFFGLDAPLHADLQVSISHDRVRVEGVIRAELGITCCLCARVFPHEMKRSFRLEYWPDPDLSPDSEEVELKYEDLDVGFYRHEELDLTGLLSEQVFLEIPMKPKCRETCKGLCDQCGADLNEGPCGCEKVKVDPRLAVLADLKKKILN